MADIASSEFFDQTISSPRLSTTSQHAGMEISTLTLPTGMIISDVGVTADQPVLLSAYNDLDAIHFSYLTAGSVQVDFGQNSQDLKHGCCNTGYAPHDRFHLRLSPGFRTIEILISPDLLESLAGEDYQKLGPNLKSGFYFNSRQNAPQMQQAAQRLSAMMSMESHSIFMVQAAALEFIAWNLDQAEENVSAPMLPRWEQRRLIEARDYLIQDLAMPPTIADLSKFSGINQLKLKRDFKHMFGQTIYGYYLSRRMQAARDLLQTQSVTETAISLGYSNVSHFSTAFRKEFGLLPRDWKQQARPS